MENISLCVPRLQRSGTCASKTRFAELWNSPFFVSEPNANLNKRITVSTILIDRVLKILIDRVLKFFIDHVLKILIPSQWFAAHFPISPAFDLQESTIKCTLWYFIPTNWERETTTTNSYQFAICIYIYIYVLQTHMNLS